MDYDKKFLIIITIPLILIIIFSTILHHVYPGILQVPNTRGPYFMKNILLDLILVDVAGIIVALFVCYHGAKSDGLFKITCFVYGSIIFTGLEECYWILSGRFNLNPFGTYYFTRGGCWFLEIPLFTCLGWFVLAWCCVYISKIIFPNSNYIFHAFLGAIMAVSLDFFIDPVMVNLGSASVYSDSVGMWVWLTDPDTSFLIFSIPFFNFLGWFLVIFLFALLYGFTLNDDKIIKRGKTKSALLFFGLIPIFLCVCFGLIYLMSFIINPLLGGVNLIPIGGT
ncbi:MAG: carotenoid biosynthesis protein [Promethearchaeota archaeon]